MAVRGVMIASADILKSLFPSTLLHEVALDSDF